MRPSLLLFGVEGQPLLQEESIVYHLWKRMYDLRGFSSAGECRGDHWSPAFCVQYPMFTGGGSPPLQGKSKVCCFGRLQLKLQFVSDKGNKLGIRGFSFGIADGIAEKSLQGIQVSSVPGYFDGMADGALHAGGRCAEMLGNGRVQRLGDGVNDVDVLHRQDDGLADILVALNMGRNTHIVDDGGDGTLRAVGSAERYASVDTRFHRRKMAYKGDCRRCRAPRKKVIARIKSYENIHFC